MAAGLGDADADSDADVDTDVDADTDADSDTSGPIDGTWLMTDCTCGGDPKELGETPNLVIYAGPTGYVEISYDGCTRQTNFTMTYPGHDTLDWTVTTLDCTPADCNASCGTTIDMHHTATYVLEGSNLTITEEHTPAGEYGCSEQRQVCNLTRQ